MDIDLKSHSKSDSKSQSLWPRIEHLLKNKLQGVMGGSFLVEAGLKSKDLATIGRGWKIVSNNQADIMRCIGHLIVLGDQTSMKPERCDLKEPIQFAISDFESLPERGGCKCEVKYSPTDVPISFWCVPRLVQLAILGLMRIIFESNREMSKSNILIQQLPSGVDLVFDGQVDLYSNDLDSNENPNSKMDHRLRESLLIEWGVAEFAIESQGGKLTSSQEVHQFRFIVELPLAPLA